MGNFTKQHLRFAYSDDNGETWYKQATERKKDELTMGSSF